MAYKLTARKAQRIAKYYVASEGKGCYVKTNMHGLVYVERKTDSVTDFVIVEFEPDNMSGTQRVIVEKTGNYGFQHCL